MSSTGDLAVASPRGPALVTAEQADQLDEFVRAVARWIAGGPFFDDEEPTESAKPPSRARRVATIVGKVLAGAAIAVVHTSVTYARIDAQRPDNWPGFVGYTEAVRLVADGLPVLWVPDHDTLAQLASAPDRPARQGVLLARRNRILAHAHAVLAEVRSDDLRSQRVLAEQALECLPSFPYPAQSLALQVAALVTMRETGSSTFAQLQKRLDTELAKLRAPQGMALIKDLGTTFMLLAVAAASTSSTRSEGTRFPRARTATRSHMS